MIEILVILSILIIAGAWIEFHYKASNTPKEHNPQTLEIRHDTERNDSISP